MLVAQGGEILNGKNPYSWGFKIWGKHAGSYRGGKRKVKERREKKY